MGVGLLIILIVVAIDSGPARSGTVVGVIVRWATAPWFMMLGREPITAEEYRAFKPYIRAVAAGLALLYAIGVLFVLIGSAWVGVK